MNISGSIFDLMAGFVEAAVFPPAAVAVQAFCSMRFKFSALACSCWYLSRHEQSRLPQRGDDHPRRVRGGEAGGDLERKLDGNYDKFVRKDGQPWFGTGPRSATVIIDDDGWMMVKRSPIRIDPPGKRDNKLRYLWCLPPFTITPLCIKVGEDRIKTQAPGAQGRVVQGTQGYARMANSRSINMDTRRSRHPNMLDAIWSEGTPVKRWNGSRRLRGRRRR